MPSLSKYVQFIQIRWAETKKDRGSKRISNDDFGYFSKKFAVEYKLLLKTGQLDDALAGRIGPRDYGKSKVVEDIKIMDIETAVKSTSQHSVKQSNSKDLSQVEASQTADEVEEEPMEIDEQEEIVVEKLENKPADLTKVASNLTNSFIAAGKALSQESLVEAVTHLSEDEDAQSEPGPHEASFDELDQRRASLIDISSQVMLADSDEANKAFLEEQPNFLPEKLSETDREIVNDLIRSQSNTDQMESDAPKAEAESEKVQSFGTEKEEPEQSHVEEIPAGEKIPAVEEIPAAEEIPAPVENDQEPDKAEEVERMETKTEPTETEVETQSAEVESVASEADADAESKPEPEPVAGDEQLESIKEVKDLPDAEKEIEEVATELSENLNADNNDSDESSDGESDDDSSASADTSAESGNLESVDEINLTQRDCEDIAVAPSESTQESTGIAPSAAAPSDMVFTENTKPVTHLVASFESIMSVESEFDAIVPCVAARAAPPAPDAVDLEEIKPSMEQKSNSEPEKATRKSFGERIKGLVRCCQQK